MSSVLHIFLHLLLDAAPLFLLGATLGAAVEAWLKPEWIERWIGGGQRSVLAAAAAGAVLPGCAMSTMPLAHSLQRRGAAVGTLTSFIMIAPILSPHTVLLTATLISVPMAVGRVVLSLLVSLTLGMALNLMQRRGLLPPATLPPGAGSASVSDGCCTPSAGGADAIPVTTDSCCEGEPLASASSWRRFLSQLGANLRSLTPYLVAGLLVAAIISALVPVETLEQSLRGGWAAYLLAAVVAIPIYVCDGGEIPLTRALLELGVGVGPAFCFMLAAVGTCFPTIGMALRIIGWRATALYLGAWLLLAIGGGVIMGILFG